MSDKKFLTGSEILTCFQAASLQLVNLWRDNETPEALAAINEMLASNKGEVIIKVHSRNPFGVQLQAVNDVEIVTLLTLCDDEPVLN